MMPGTHITEEDRRAATTVTTSGAGHKFEIQLGHLCNNRCVFCSSGQLTAMKIARPVPLEPIVEATMSSTVPRSAQSRYFGSTRGPHVQVLRWRTG